MARIRKAGGGPVKKKHATPKKRRRRDLEDLYQSVIEDDKLKTIQKKEKKAKVEENAEVLNETDFAPIAKLDVSSLLSLLSDADSDSDRTKITTDSSSTNDEYQNGCHRDDSSGSDVVKDEADEMTRRNVGEDADQGECVDEGEAKIEGLCSKEEQERLENLNPAIADDGSDFDGTETADEVEVNNEDCKSHLDFDGYGFESFNNQIPSTFHKVQEDSCSTTVTPPGYSPFNMSTDSGSQSRVKALVQSLPNLQVNSKSISDLKSIPSSMSEKVWNRWIAKVLPNVLQHEHLWQTYTNQSEEKPENSQESFLHSIQALTYFQLNLSYSDIIMTDQNYSNSHCLRAMSCLHIVNHIVRMRSTQAKNNKSLKSILDSQNANELHSKKKRTFETQPKASESKVDHLSDLLDSSGDDRYRDQGFTRPKVLILTPTRQTAKDFVEILLDLLPGTKQIRNKKRFEIEFGPDDCVSYAQREADCSGDLLRKKGKPLDFAELFRGNSSDQFRLGIRIHSSSATLFSPFYQSDVIIASPLGLRLVVGTQGQTDRDFDFLSSIEILLIDRADVLKNQNWEHVKDSLDVMNQKLKTWRSECDIRRLRISYMNNLAQQFRQTIILSNGRRAEYNSLYSSLNQSRPLCNNFRGLVKLSQCSDGTAIKNGSLRVAKQLFLSVPCDGFASLNEVLLQYLSHQFPPPFLSVNENDSILLVVPTYVEYLRVRKILKNSQLAARDCRQLTNFRACHEYSSNQMLSQSRSMFFSGIVKLLITTERFLFYRRYLLRGAHHVLFLGPPDYPEIYADCLKSLKSPSYGISCVLYTKFHSLQIERLVGIKNLKSLLSPKTSKLFVVG